MFEMLAGRSPFDVVGAPENPDQNTEDYLFQSKTVVDLCFYNVIVLIIILLLCLNRL